MPKWPPGWSILKPGSSQLASLERNRGYDPEMRFYGGEASRSSVATKSMRSREASRRWRLVSAPGSPSPRFDFCFFLLFCWLRLNKNRLTIIYIYSLLDFKLDHNPWLQGSLFSVSCFFVQGLARSDRWFTAAAFWRSNCTFPLACQRAQRCGNRAEADESSWVKGCRSRSQWNPKRIKTTWNVLRRFFFLRFHLRKFFHLCCLTRDPTNNVYVACKDALWGDPPQLCIWACKSFHAQFVSSAQSHRSRASLARSGGVQAMGVSDALNSMWGSLGRKAEAAKLRKGHWKFHPSTLQCWCFLEAF